MECRISRSNGPVLIGDQIQIADTFFARLKGLLGVSELQEGEGLLISPCSSIHCFGMKFVIDAIFLDKDFRVVAIHSNLKPGAMASNRKARHVLELKAGEAAKHGIEIGEQLIIIPNH